MVQLYQSLGDEDTTRKCLASVHKAVNKLDTSSEEEDNESDKENMTMMSNTTITSNESDKESTQVTNNN